MNLQDLRTRISALLQVISVSIASVMTSSAAHFHGLLMASSVFRSILPGAESLGWCSRRDATSEPTHLQVGTTEPNILISADVSFPTGAAQIVGANRRSGLPRLVPSAFGAEGHLAVELCG